MAAQRSNHTIPQILSQADLDHALSRAAAAAVLDDLAHGRVVGKQLGERPPRFRHLYRDLDASTREIVASGERDQDAIYRTICRTAVARLPE